MTTPAIACRRACPVPRKRPRCGPTAAVGVLAVLAATAGAAAKEITLYRIPIGDDGRHRYSDVRPPARVKYEEVRDFERTERPVILRSGRRKIIVYHPKGEDREGGQIRDDVWYAVRLCERIAGIPYPGGRDIKVYKVPESDIGSAAQHREEEGILTSGAGHFLMYHEIAHYWMNFDLFKDRWLAEGYAELCAYIVGLRTRGLEAAEAYRLRRLRGVKDYPGDDFDLERWGRGEKTTLDRERFAYGKGMTVCAMLLNRVGLFKLQQVNRAIRRRRKPVTTREYYGLLEKAVGPRSGIDEIFSGWVISGGYYVKGKRVSFSAALRAVEREKPKVPTFLDPGREALHPTSRPTTSKPVGYFVDEHGNRIDPSQARPRPSP